LPTRIFTLDLSVSLQTFVQRCESACHYHICQIAAMLQCSTKRCRNAVLRRCHPTTPLKRPNS